MYHDAKNLAAVTVYTDPTEKFVIEGIITEHFGIKSLPKRLAEFIPKEQRNVLETPIVNKGSNITDAEEETGFCVVFKVPSIVYITKRSVPENLGRTESIPEAVNSSISVDRNWVDNPNSSISVDLPSGGQNVPKVVYPEILIVLDYNAIRNRTITEALRFTLAFWNGVDTIYRAVDEPEIYLNIAGIIIGTFEWATIFSPYPKNIRTYFSKETVRFPMERYDVVVVMLTDDYYGNSSPNTDNRIGQSIVSDDCSGAFKNIMGPKNCRGYALTTYKWTFVGVDTAAHEVAHLLGVNHDGTGPNNFTECAKNEGYIMTERVVHTIHPFAWSNCSLSRFSNFFSEPTSEYFRNEPRWTKPVDEVLPGRWLTMDGQCRNIDYDEACELNETSICMEKGCRKEGSDTCVATGRAFLPGTKCGSNKYCDRKNDCVDES